KGYTAKRLPVRLLFSEELSSRVDALIAERRIKGWCRKKKEALIKGDWDEISRLARNKTL
ncbi:MAG TPA: GIY-YIG nuclease family protein, partial [Thermodesulfobacteriota bacterium]|nr:GIY-YIG nuclease family protein [Thermodesulfobacteriota bacterium]